MGIWLQPDLRMLIIPGKIFQLYNYLSSNISLETLENTTVAGTDNYTNHLNIFSTNVPLTDKPTTWLTHTWYIGLKWIKNEAKQRKG